MSGGPYEDEDIDNYIQQFQEKLDQINRLSNDARNGLKKLRPNYGLDWIEELKRRL